MLKGGMDYKGNWLQRGMGSKEDMTVTDGFEDKGAKAMPQHEVDAQLLREKTARLRELRLAQAGTAAKSVAVKKKVRKSGEKSNGKGVPLSDWLSAQQKEGRRN
jgi:hypothetical protein